MNSAWYSAGDAKFSFFDFRWSKLLFTVFFSSSFYLYVRLLVLHLFSARHYSFSIRCNFILHDNEENCLRNVRSWFTSSLDYNSHWWFFFTNHIFFPFVSLFFFMSKFPSTLKFKSLCLISFKCFAFQVLLFLFTCWCYRFIMPTSYFAVIHQNTSSSSKKPSNEALMCKPYSDSANNGT